MSGISECCFCGGKAKQGKEEESEKAYGKFEGSMLVIILTHSDL